MNVLLIYPYPKIENVGCYPPISLLYLSTPLLKAGHKVKVIDVDAYNYNDEVMIEEAETFNPSLIGLPLFSSCLSDAYAVLEVIKNHFPNAFSLLGGPHATAMPDKVMQEFRDCDFVIRGEGEETILELANAIEKKHSVRDILGLSYRKNGQIVHNPDRSIKMNLDEIDFPARHLLAQAYNKNIYYRVGYRGPTDLILSARGCPYQCTFCFKTVKKFRMRTVDNVLSEIEEILSSGIRSIHFCDDTFAVDRNRCEKILNGVRSLRTKVYFKIRSQSSNVDRDLLKLMKEVNVESIVYGFESGSQKILDLMNKKIKVEENYRACKETINAGIQCHGDMFIGYPGETEKTIEETKKFLFTARPTAFKFAVGCVPYPGTKIYNEYKAQGILSNDWSVFLPKPYIKHSDPQFYEKIKKEAKLITKSYYLQPSVVLNVLKKNLLNTSFKGLRNLVKWYFGLLYFG